MKKDQLIFISLLVLTAALVLLDRLYISKFEEDFKQIESQRILISNRLATAKIVSENLEHVRELVFENIDFGDHKDSVEHETVIFDFLTNCINDLKLKLISLEPQRPVSFGRITKYGYSIELESDFFSFGELCSTLENSMRLNALEQFQVEIITKGNGVGTPSQARSSNGRSSIHVKMFLNTFRVKKV